MTPARDAKSSCVGRCPRTRASKARSTWGRTGRSKNSRHASGGAPSAGRCDKTYATSRSSTPSVRKRCRRTEPFRVGGIALSTSTKQSWKNVRDSSDPAAAAIDAPAADDAEALAAGTAGSAALPAWAEAPAWLKAPSTAVQSRWGAK